jgi:hypothetical protein
MSTKSQPIEINPKLEHLWEHLHNIEDGREAFCTPARPPERLGILECELPLPDLDPLWAEPKERLPYVQYGRMLFPWPPQ